MRMIEAYSQLTQQSNFVDDERGGVYIDFLIDPFSLTAELLFWGQN